MDYTVRNRDTLSSIARRFQTSVDALARENNLSNPDRLRAGQTIRVPGDRDDFAAAQRAPVALQNPWAPIITAPPAAQQTAPSSVVPSRSPTASAPPAAAPTLMDRLWSRWEQLTGRPGLGQAQQTNGQGDRQLNVPFYLQTERGHGFTPGRRQCFVAASKMATDAGGNVLPVGDRIQVATAEDRSGRITVDPAAAARGRSRIDSELDAGRPVVVGVSHSDHRYNADRITDHFVTITGRGTDEQGRTFYTFNDPATRAGQDTNPRNRFYVDPSNGMLYRPEDYTSVGWASRRFEVSMVR